MIISELENESFHFTILAYLMTVVSLFTTIFFANLIFFYPDYDYIRSLEHGVEQELQVLSTRAHEDPIDPSPFLKGLDHTEAFERYHAIKSQGSPLSSPSVVGRLKPPPAAKKYLRDNETPDKHNYPSLLNYDVSPSSGYEQMSDGLTRDRS